MSEMVERLAQQICAVYASPYGECVCARDGRSVAWQVYKCTPACVDADAAARAAIEAMRKPTPQMVAEANRLNHPRDAEVWSTMISAALSPSELEETK